MTHKYEVEMIVREATAKLRARFDKALAKRDAKIEALEQQISILRERLGWIDERLDGGYR